MSLQFDKEGEIILPKVKIKNLEANKEKIREILLKRGEELMNAPKKFIEFSGNKEADILLNDLEKNPHAYVLACVMDRQIKAEKAWGIPYLFSKEIGSFEFQKLILLSEEDCKRIFQEKKLHRFNEQMAINFYLAIQKIHEKYNDDASNIWKENLSSNLIVRKFLEFRGVGVKIATMATNILARSFKIPMSDYKGIDISPDIQVKKVFERIGFIPKKSTNEILIYGAKELNPEYPGIFDFSCWEIGRKWCRTTNPKCNDCYLNKYCKKNI